ncbi:APC family permease [Dermatophilaceae bacterium Soc4.6]
MSPSEEIPVQPGRSVAAQPDGRELRTGALGLRSVVFQNMTNMAPAAAIVYDFPTQIAAAGAALWISNSIALFAVLLIASSIIQFSRQLPHAGGYYTYLSTALGPKVGAFSAWIYFLYALVLPAEVTLIWSGIASDLVSTYLHLGIPWWVFQVVILGLVGYLAFTGVQRSARITMIAGAFEIAVFVVLGVSLLVNPVSPINLGDLSLSSSPSGWEGVLGLGLVFGILNFVGFESAAPMAEETDNPTRNVPRAVLFSVLILGTLYLFMSVAAVFGYGLANLGNFFSDAAPFDTMANRVLGIGTLVVFFAITNSSFGCSLATINQGSRVLMSMGRNGLLPAQIGAVHPLYRTPHVAAAIISALALVISLTAGAVWGTLVGFGVLAITLTAGALMIYILGNIALPVFYRNHVPAAFSWLLHLVLPVVAVVLLGYVFYRNFWPIPDSPYNLPGYFAVGWAVVGLVLVSLASRFRPQSLQAVLSDEAS